MKIRIIALLLSISAMAHAEPVTVKAQKEITLSEEDMARAKMMTGGKELPADARQGLVMAKKNALFHKIVADVRTAVYKLKQENYAGTLADSLEKAASLGCKLDDLAYASYRFTDGGAIFKGDESPYILIKVGEQVIGILQNGEKQEKNQHQ